MSDNTDTSKKSHKVLWSIVILLLIILIGGGGYGGWVFYNMKKGGAPAAEVAVPVAPIFLPLDSFTVNLANPDNDPDRVLYVVITLRLADEATEKGLTEYLPEVRSRVVTLLSHQQADELPTEEGKQKLAADIKNVLSQPYLGATFQPNISDVLFTTFILR